MTFCIVVLPSPWTQRGKMQEFLRSLLGGNFGPEKKYLAPPPKIPRTNPPAPSPPRPHPPGRPPPGVFNKKSPQRLGLPFPLPRAGQ